ncbi:MAG TPA: hypothetical protein VIR29_11600, partial [Anseongella sp.]
MPTSQAERAIRGISHPGIKIREFMEEINSVTESVISNWFHERLLQWGVSEGLAVYLNLLGLLFALTVIVIVVAYLTRKILVEAVSRIASKTNSRFDDFLVGNRTMAYVAR